MNIINDAEFLKRLLMRAAKDYVEFENEFMNQGNELSPEQIKNEIVKATQNKNIDVVYFNLFYTSLLYPDDKWKTKTRI